MSFFSNLDTEGYDRQYTDRQLAGRMVEYFSPQLKTYDLHSNEVGEGNQADQGKATEGEAEQQEFNSF